ncbi:phosphomannomutase [Pseudorhizobium tarimense]|uniref:Phosphomannomutase n=1 Tax=Pseudorhizobium tarimense TaxID=1079109 RepID=A0ABV2HAU0_9HYPH|nr:phosphomannomutase [Pseudorhizobium tarimense]MCJ8520793.1 phosphomannomutase [Pseudorhizobium tarimense]
MKFGTSGLRGLSSDLKGPPSYRYAKAFGLYLLESGKARKGARILIARDFRDSSPKIAANCTAALIDLGFAVVDCGTVPTPALALYGLETNSASLMITGSHIPADRNGIKFYRPDGEIGKEDETAITRIASSLGNENMDAQASAVTNEEEACRTLFLKRNRALLAEGALNGLRIGVYLHSTVARDMMVDVLTSYGADVVPLGRSETFIPVDTEAVSEETLEKLGRWAAEHRLDAVVSADGDGDRPLVADETGTVIRGDVLGLVAAQFLDAAVVVTPVTSNSGVEAAGNYDVVRTRVGSPYVIAGMEEAVAGGRDCVMGFEANGGLLTCSDFTINGHQVRALPTRDCFLPILAILSLARRHQKPLSQVVAFFNLPVAAADRLENFPIETSTALMAYLRRGRAELSQFLETIGAVAMTSDIDGLRVTLEDGRIIHFRPSGNAPEMRCYVEAKDETAAAALLRAGLERIRGWARAAAAG